ncbi:hypothetical protein F3J44_05710 [Pantoea sp. Tr-811]|nr:hypothetical protein [Pantoea sp. Tr-811]
MLALPRLLWNKSKLSDLTDNPVGAGLPREAGAAVHGTGCAGVRGASPLLQGVASPYGIWHALVVGARDAPAGRR